MKSIILFLISLNIIGCATKTQYIDRVSTIKVPVVVDRPSIDLNITESNLSYPEKIAYIKSYIKQSQEVGKIGK